MEPVKLDKKYFKAAQRAIDLNIPFALIIPPGSTDIIFYASEPDDEFCNSINVDRVKGEVFIITPYGAELNESYAVYEELTADDILALPKDEPKRPVPYHHASAHDDTYYGYYYCQIKSILKEIRKKKVEKVVISRQIISDGWRMKQSDYAYKYFSMNPSAYRALYFTTETGLWVTATPELLLRAEKGDGVMKLSTRAVAGTRTILPNRNPEEWDDKNIREHDIVRDFITDTLTKHGVDYTVEGPLTQRYGTVDHLVDEIRGTGREDMNIFALINDLNPTPALAGYPVKKAMKIIEQTELHKRLLYGGLIGRMTREGYETYVNIRCAYIHHSLRTLKLRYDPVFDEPPSMRCTIFAGGGIVEGSNPYSEWVEASFKAENLLEALSVGASLSEDWMIDRSPMVKVDRPKVFN